MPMMVFLLAALLLALALFLTAEVWAHNHRLRRVPLRITVSGTRGKTTVVRTLASVMRSAGYRVLAKTTGSQARYILPDGSEEPVRRYGITTILEQKKLMRRAAGLRCDCLIAEIMSIQPANHLVETRQLLKPGMTILTNFRTDHTDAVPDHPEAIAALFSNDINPGSTVFVPRQECTQLIREAIWDKGARLVEVEPGAYLGAGLTGAAAARQVPENLDLVTAAAMELGIASETIAKGVAQARMDIGNPLIFKIQHQNKTIWFINAFAANDPLSTKLLLGKTEEMIGAGPKGRFALLSLRSDRGERSLQWMLYLLGEGRGLFEKVYLSGGHARVLQRRIPEAEILKGHSPGSLTRQLASVLPDGARVYGIGNIGGMGGELVREWEKTASDVL